MCSCTVILTPWIIISSHRIKAVVQITDITAYMMIGCTRLGACALSIISIVAMVSKYYGWQLVELERWKGPRCPGSRQLGSTTGDNFLYLNRHCLCIGKI
jgi:hypothetical protein